MIDLTGLQEDVERQVRALEAQVASDAVLIQQLSDACQNAESEPEWLHMALTDKDAELAATQDFIRQLADTCAKAEQEALALKAERDAAVADAEGWQHTLVFLATAVLNYPDFDCDHPSEPRPLCMLARNALTAIAARKEGA
jgi:chromosome segregation ATPase